MGEKNPKQRSVRFPFYGKKGDVGDDLKWYVCSEKNNETLIALTPILSVEDKRYEGASFTQGMIYSIPIGGSVSPEGFLLPILLLVVIIVMVVIVAVILVVVVVVAIVGVVIVVNYVLLPSPLISGLWKWLLPGFEVLKRQHFFQYFSRAILIGQQPFQFSPSDLVGLLYSNRFGIGIPPGQGILGESTSSKFHFAVLGISGGGVVDLTGDEDPTNEDEDIGMGDSTRVQMSLGKISSGGKKSHESNIGDSDNTRDEDTTVRGAIGA
nr:hypothetical protein [Tanacetum cinerariifolium]